VKQVVEVAFGEFCLLSAEAKCIIVAKSKLKIKIQTYLPNTEVQILLCALLKEKN